MPQTHILHQDMLDSSVQHREFTRQTWEAALRDPTIRSRWTHAPGDCCTKEVRVKVKDGAHVCDNPVCKKPITFICHRGREGEYCSNQCYQTVEGKDTMSKKRKKLPKDVEVEVEETTWDVPEGKIEEDEPTEEAEVAEPKPKKKKAKPPSPVKAKAKAKAKVPKDAEVKGPRIRLPHFLAVYELLSDEKPHAMVEVDKVAKKAGLPENFIRRGLGGRNICHYLADYGRRTGQFTVTRDKEADTIQLENA